MTLGGLGDVRSLNGREIRVVIDDRVEAEKAEVERQILGSLVKAMRLSKLLKLAHPGSTH